MSSVPPQYFMPDPLDSYFDASGSGYQFSYPAASSSAAPPSSESSHFARTSSSSAATTLYELSNLPISINSTSSSPTITFGHSMPMSDYTLEQMEAICKSLFQARDGDRLVAFFKQLEDRYGSFQLDNWRFSETVVVAYTYALYHSNDFETLFQLLSSRPFHHSHFSDLQEIWHHARYKESQLKRGKELNPVEKYRLRRKFPPPKTIWDGEETVYSFKDSSRKYLKHFYRDTTQYPSQEQKREISRATGLKVVQISNWFKNRRQRDKPSTSDKCSPPSSSSSTAGSNDFTPIITPQSFNMAAAAAYNMNMNMFYDSIREI
uniref:Homeobox domain-containing protein n=1 Tax=Caenorhabditis japonica TaxID=281687 RepID=A0A8R1DED0_CAEJA